MENLIILIFAVSFYLEDDFLKMSISVSNYTKCVPRKQFLKNINNLNM